jgi:hypothetical protein
MDIFSQTGYICNSTIYILADTFTDLSTLSLGTDRGGKYYLYTVDTIRNVSVRSINNITVIAGNCKSIG